MAALITHSSLFMWLDFASLNTPIVVGRFFPARSSDVNNISYKWATRPDCLSNAETTVMTSSFQGKGGYAWVNNWHTVTIKSWLTMKGLKQNKLHFVLFKYHNRIIVGMLAHRMISGKEHIKHRQIVLSSLSICWLFQNFTKTFSLIGGLIFPPHVL